MALLEKGSPVILFPYPTGRIGIPKLLSAQFSQFIGFLISKYYTTCSRDCLPLNESISGSPSSIQSYSIQVLFGDSMDSDKGSAIVKNQEEVVLMIPMESKAAENSSNSHANFAKSKTSSPDISKSPGVSPRKPHRSPQSEPLVRRRSVVKPKSRFEEPSRSIDKLHTFTHSPSSPYSGSPNLKSAGTPKTPNTPNTPRPNAEEEDEEEEDEVYKKELLQERGKLWKKFRVRLLIEWLILILVTASLITSLLLQRLQRNVIWGLEIWKWCLMVMVIFCGHLLTHWFITVLVLLINANFLFRKKLIYFVYGLKLSFQIFLWLGLVLLSWLLIFHDIDFPRSEKATKALSYVSKFLGSLLIGSFLWLVKTLLVMILASSFDMERYFDRIQETLYHQYFLQALSGPPVMEMAEKIGPSKSSGQLSFRSMVKGKGKGKVEKIEVIDISKLYRMNQEKVSAWTMRGLVNVIRSSGLSTNSSKIEESDDEDMQEQKVKEITNEGQARAAAYQIFKNVAKPGYKYIEVEDLMRFLSKEEVAYALPLLEGPSETGKIKKSALRFWVVKAYLERKFLAHSLNDTKTAVKQLHKVLTAIVIVLIIIIMLLMTGLATTKVLVFMSSQLLLIAFIFSNSCKTVFEAIVFVFVMHPFDVGDRCVIDDVQMIVEEMNILTTIFLQSDNTKVYYPNSILSTKPIRNFYRSPDMGDSVEFSVSFPISMEKISDLKARIKMYIESKPNHWHQNHSIVVMDIVDMNAMNMVLYVTHTINHQNMVEKNARRTDLVLELKKIFEDLSVCYNLLPQGALLDCTIPNPPPAAIRKC